MLLNRVFTVVLCIVLFGIGGSFWYTHSNQGAEAQARAIVRSCAGAGDHAKCYETTVPKLYPKMQVPDIIDVIRDIRIDDPSYQFCHVLAHELGEAVVANDPNNWIDAIHYNPSDGLCSNGFIHGVIIGRFRNVVLDDATFEKFLPSFKIACEAHDGWTPTDLDRAICYHGMGHLFTYITNADLPNALARCKETVPGDFERVCIEGVFMQIYQPLEPDDYTLIANMKVKPTADTVPQFCAAFKDPLYVGACLRESWPFSRTELKSGSGVVQFCARSPNAEQTDECYQSASSIIGRFSLGNPAGAAVVCNGLPADRQETCFAYSAGAVLEEDRSDGSKAIDLCGRASATVARACLMDLASRAQFTFGRGTQEYTQFCASLPANIRSACSTSDYQ